MEKRREKRLDEENKVVLHVLAEDGQEKQSFYSFSRDLSVGGLRIMTDSPLPVKTKLKIEIALSESKKVISGLAEVRWVKSYLKMKFMKWDWNLLSLIRQARFSFWSIFTRGQLLAEPSSPVQNFKAKKARPGLFRPEFKQRN